MSEKTKLFALIVGINKYEGAPLNGCVPDAKKIKAYLESRDDLDIPKENILMLLDEAGTKKNIVNAFRKHLSKAGPEDVALFYFSGHGAQEWADENIWINEQDDCLETIVCYSETKTALLADKELRFLIHELAYGSEEIPKAPPHILTIFDCCHSGDNTRSIATRSAEEETRERRFRHIFPQREWNDFIFAKSIKETDFAMATIKELLPQGPHVQLAAAQDKQPALEIANAGLFTQKLLQVLDISGGKIDYNSLHSLVSNYIRFRYKQVPQLAVQGGRTDMLRAGFLNQAVEYDGDFYGKVSYNKSKGWLLNMGQMHGLGVKYPVIIYFGDKEEELLIDKVYASTSEIKIDHDVKEKLSKKGIELDKGRYYKAKVQAYGSYPVNYYINDQIGEPGFVKRLLKEIEEETEGPINIVEVEGEADYTVHFNYEKIFITEAFDPFRPVVEIVKLSQKDWENRVSSKMDNLTIWEFALNLDNNAVKVLRKHPIGVEVLQQKNNEMQPVPTDNNCYIIDEVNWDEDDEKYRAYITIRLTNNYKHSLYFCLIILSEERESDVSVDNDDDYGLVEKVIMELQPGQTYEVFQHYNSVIPFVVKEHALSYNKQYSTTWFKLLISTRDDISYQHLLTEKFKAPDLPKKNIEDWTTQLIELKLVNPRHNKVIEQEIHAMLSDPEMTPFATGLYLSTARVDNELIFKPEFDVIRSDGGE